MPYICTFILCRSCKRFSIDTPDDELVLALFVTAPLTGNEDDGDDEDGTDANDDLDTLMDGEDSDKDPDEVDEYDKVLDDELDENMEEEQDEVQQNRGDSGEEQDMVEDISEDEFEGVEWVQLRREVGLKAEALMEAQPAQPPRAAAGPCTHCWYWRAGWCARAWAARRAGDGPPGHPKPVGQGSRPGPRKTRGQGGREAGRGG